MADSLFIELKRRNVFRVCAAYLAGAWLLIEVADTLLSTFGYDDSVIRFVIIALAIGLIPVSIFSWVYEYTSQGLIKESEIDYDKVTSVQVDKKLDFLIIGLLVVSTSYFIWESRFKSIDLPTASGTSIAVLPFVNMSSDPEQEYFSDGISEEILNVLAQIPKLHVTSRSSAFSFKGDNIIISEVASKLGVKNILEGSVRKSGNRIRITAQLIEATSDKHLWSETYDRELTVDNIFDIQDEISAAIVLALKTELGLDAKVASRKIVDVNLDAHNEYLQGRFFVEKRTQENIDIALSHFDTAIELAPEYALAWMGKAKAYLYSSEINYGIIPDDEALKKAIPAIEKAMLLDPELPEVNAMMGWILINNSEKEKGISYLEKAIQLNPSYSDAYTSLALYKTDNPVEELKILKKARQLNPMSISDNDNYASYLTRFGKLDEAEKIVKHMLALNASHYAPYLRLADIRIVQRRQAKAALLAAKAVELTSGLIYRKYIAASLYADIGLQQQAAELMDKTPFEMIKHRFSGNLELYVNQTREKFPRNDNDSFGMMARATAELYAGNYTESVKYLRLTPTFCSRCSQRIYVYFLVGDNEAAQQLLDKVKDPLTKSINAGIQYYTSLTYIVPIEIKSMEVAFLEGNIDRAIMHLKSAMKKKYILSFEYKYNPMYKKLRAHKDWPSILDESEKLADEQNKIYQKLVIDGTDITL